MSGWAKALWSLFVIIIPLVGTLVYLIARGGGMAERTAAEAQRREEQVRDYVRNVTTDAAPASTADELAKLAQLRDAGTITPAEFETQKAKLLA
jgi:hypothetical protein